MNFEQLRYFELAYEERNFSAAARRVPMSHQGLVKSIHALERELGVVLFSYDEDASTLIATPYADEFFEFACAFDDNVRLLKETFTRLRAEERHVIRLGCSLGVIGAYGPSFLDDFMARHPHTEVQYWESNERVLEKELKARQCDMALCVAPVTEGCVGTMLYESPFYLWVRRDGPLGELSELSFGDLGGYSIAIPGSGFKCFDCLQGACAEAGVSLGHVFEISEIFQIYNYVMEGRGLGFANGTLIGLSVFQQNADIVALPVNGLTWGFAIERLQSHVPSASEQKLRDWCRAAASKLPGNTLFAVS